MIYDSLPVWTITLMIKSILEIILWLWNITKRYLFMIRKLRIFCLANSLKDEYIPKKSKFEINAPVTFSYNKVVGGGYVEWTGSRTFDEGYPLVLIRLTEDVPGSTSGDFDGVTFENQPKCNYLMVAEHCVTLPPQFIDGDFCVVLSDDMRRTEMSGFVKKDKDLYYKLWSLGQECHSSVPSFRLRKAPPPVTDECSDNTPPISQDKLELFCGRNKGIQGRQNSCYLDTLLFSVFTFSDVILNDLVAKEQEGDFSKAFYEALSCLRYEIVYPLRAFHFVSDEHVYRLRRLIAEETGKEQFEGETRDIPECMDALFCKILGWTPELSIGDRNNQDLHFYESFTTELLSNESNSILTTIEMLEFSAISMSFCYEKVPQLLMLQLPRGYNRTVEMIPSLEINLNLFLHNCLKECCSCGRNATLQFPKLAEEASLKQSFLCRSCAEKRDLNVETARPLPDPPVPDGDEPDTRLSLMAVLCIERSHYNCFARCEDRWVFFDSMSDQEQLTDPVTLKPVTFNIPLVREVPEFASWITNATAIVKKDPCSLERLYEETDLEDRPLAERLFKTPYLAMYTPLPPPKFSVPT